jgi:hypothetical protein
MIEQHLMIRTDDSLPLCSTPYLTPASQWSCSPRPLASAGSGNISGIDEMSSSESDSTIPADTSDNRDVSKSTDSRTVITVEALVHMPVSQQGTITTNSTTTDPAQCDGILTTRNTPINSKNVSQSSNAVAQQGTTTTNPTTTDPAQCDVATRNTSVISLNVSHSATASVVSS